MDKSNLRSNTLALSGDETGQTANPVASFLNSVGNLSPGTVVFNRREIRYVRVMSPRPTLRTRDQGSQADSQPCTLASTNTQTDDKTGHSVITEEEEAEEEEEECSRDELIKINLEQHLIYISHCIKPDDLILHLHYFSEEQKSDIQAEKNLIKASRKALEMLLRDVKERGRFVALRDALHKNDGYPKIVRILDGEYHPEDQNYVKVVELFAPEIIVRLEPAELLPFLLQKGVFKDMDVQEIRAEQTIHGQMRAACVLLMYLPRRTVDWFRCFLQALIDCKLEDIAEMLDPDIFKDLYLKSNKQTDVISWCANTNKAKPAKPKIAPKPKISVSPSKANTDISKQSGVGCSDARRKKHTEDDRDRLAYNRINNPDKRIGLAEDKLGNTEGLVIYSEFNVEKIDYLLNNPEDRLKIVNKMGKCDAEIVWPDKESGKKQILLKSISLDETDVGTWSRKRKVWKCNVMSTFKKLFAKISLSKKQSKCACPNVSKIISSKGTCGKQNISQGKLNAVSWKKPGNVPCSAKETTDPIREESSSYSRIAAVSSDEIETSLESMTVCETHTIASNANNETVLAESNGSNRNHPLLSEEHQNKLESEILCPENMKKYAICRMANGRRIIILEGPLEDIRVDVMVNTTDHHLSFETGLAETISEKGGEIIKKACRTYMHKHSLTSIDEGDVFVSKEVGDLPTQHLIHVNSPIWRGGEKKEDKLLKQSVIKIMLQATVENARTIAMPAIGCGTSGFPKKIGTELIVRAVENFFREEPDSCLQDVYIVDIDTKVSERFTDALLTVFKKEPNCSIEKIEES